MKAGKYMGFKRISNSLGQFEMLALDQRGALRRLISAFREVREPEDLISVKTAILKTLSKSVSAVLIDPEFGFPDNLRHVPARTGVIVAVEKTGYVESVEEKGRLSELVSEDIIERVKLSGADAVKLLLYWSENASEKVKAQQMKITGEVGKRCEEQGLLYILEVVTYDTAPQGREFHVMSSVKLFSRDEYCVDLFKIEPFEPVKSSLTRSDVQQAAQGKPWVILSGGMDVFDFAKTLEFNCSLGASGFLGGRVIWKKAVELIDSQDLMEEYLSTSGIYSLEMIKEASKRAIPYYLTPHIGGHERLTLE